MIEFHIILPKCYMKKIRQTFFHQHQCKGSRHAAIHLGNDQKRCHQTSNRSGPHHWPFPSKSLQTIDPQCGNKTNPTWSQNQTIFRIIQKDILRYLLLYYIWFFLPPSKRTNFLIFSSPIERVCNFDFRSWR